MCAHGHGYCFLARSSLLAQIRRDQLQTVATPSNDGETKGSPESGFEWARHNVSPTFRVASMIWQMLSGGKKLMYSLGNNRVDVGTDN